MCLIAHPMACSVHAGYTSTDTVNRPDFTQPGKELDIGLGLRSIGHPKPESISVRAVRSDGYPPWKASGHALAGIWPQDALERQPRRAASIAATSIFPISIMASNARFASAPPAASASVRTRGVICHETPHLSLHQPQALSCPPLPTMGFPERSVSS